MYSVNIIVFDNFTHAVDYQLVIIRRGGAKIQTMATAIYAEMNELLNWPAAAALSLILLVFTLAVTYVYAHILETRYVKVMHL